MGMRWQVSSDKWKAPLICHSRSYNGGMASFRPNDFWNHFPGWTSVTYDWLMVSLNVIDRS